MSRSDNLKAIFQEIDNASSVTPIHIVDAIRQSLLHKFDEFKIIYAEFSQFLSQTGTEDSISENLTVSTKYTAIYANVDSCYKRLVSTTERAEPNVATSVYSSVKSSKWSKTSTMIARILAKVEAAKAK